MTPLAQKIVNERTLPLKDRTFRDQCNLLAAMDDVHCFEVTAVCDTADALTQSFYDQAKKAGRMSDKLAFLPAPRTWLEYSFTEDGHLCREGVLICHAPSVCQEEAVLFWAYQCDDHGIFLSASKLGFLKLQGADFSLDSTWRTARDQSSMSQAEMTGWTIWMYAILAMINTPRVIGRRQHMPHAGLQRKLARSKGMTGKFPLHAWTEIRLEVTPPHLDPSAIGEPHEARLTGARALHFCRCHLRIRLGQLELVTAHWRGDPALGIKQSRYVLTPPENRT